jgi:hypothetical protein
VLPNWLTEKKERERESSGEHSPSVVISEQGYFKVGAVERFSVTLCPNVPNVLEKKMFGMF